MFYAVANLTAQQTQPVDPWAFAPEKKDVPAEQIRKDKVSRQEFYRNIATRWQFYTSVEAIMSTARPGKDNPPRLIHGFVVDFDLEIDDDRIDAAVLRFPIAPSYVERSLGGNFRLVWVLEQPFLANSLEHATFIFQKARKWLKWDLLPGIDAGACEDPCRLYCNGAVWRPTGAAPVRANEVQARTVEWCREYNFKEVKEGLEIPLAVVEKRLQELFPGLNWPASFDEESQGPSFWVPGSTSPMSAIVKKTGMLTFSAHATKVFYTWPEILGAEWVKTYETDSISEATKDIFFDGRNYWRVNPRFNRFKDESSFDLQQHMLINCGVSAKSDKLGSSPMQRAMQHIRDYGRVNGGLPFLYKPQGYIEVNRQPWVNTWVGEIVRPATESTEWGESGKFPFLSKFIGQLFDPVEPQLSHFLAWYRYAYVNALEGEPQPGQILFLAGEVNVGKTLLNRQIVGYSLGGITDGSDFLLGKDIFTSDFFDAAVWSIDDETTAGSEASHARYTAVLKKLAANGSFRYNKKFHSAGMVNWCGRVIVTLNLDVSSRRMLPALDTGILDKVNFYRMIEKKKSIPFPPRFELIKIIQAELPYFLRWLVAWTPPESVLVDGRFGYASYHEASIMETANQGSQSALFKETLIRFLLDYFASNKEKRVWKGTTTDMLRGIASDCLNESITRGYKLEQYSRFMEALLKGGAVKCRVETGAFQLRLWVFDREDFKEL